MPFASAVTSTSAALRPGVIAGKRDLVAAAAMNGKGIGRAMKPSKEGVVSVIERMEWLADLDYAAWEAGQNAKVDVMVAALQGIPGVNVFAERDVTGNPQYAHQDRG